MKTKNTLSLVDKSILLTSIDDLQQSNEDYKLEDNIIQIPQKTSFSFPKIRYSKNLYKTVEIKNLQKFISPNYKTSLEITNFKKIKKKLTNRKFIELHKFKLKINPKNFYNNYGLNDYLLIINNKNDKSKNYNDYRYNNISSYNNKFKIKEEKKNNGINSISENFKKNSKEFSLKRVPYRLKNQRKQNGIMKYFFNDEKTLFDVNSIWRGKNINDLIHTTINFNFFDNFRINSRTIGKIKFHE